MYNIRNKEPKQFRDHLVLIYVYSYIFTHHDRRVTFLFKQFVIKVEYSLMFIQEK